MIYGCVCEVTVTKEIDRVSGELHRVQSSLWSKSMRQLQAARKAAKARECRVWHCEISSQSLYVLNIKPSLFLKKKKKPGDSHRQRSQLLFEIPSQPSGGEGGGKHREGGRG